MGNGKIYVVGIGPGSEEDITPAVKKAVSIADAIVGYKYYFSFIQFLVKADAECVVPGCGKNVTGRQRLLIMQNRGKQYV